MVKKSFQLKVVKRKWLSWTYKVTLRGHHHWLSSSSWSYSSHHHDVTIINVLPGNHPPHKLCSRYHGDVVVYVSKATHLHDHIENSSRIFLQRKKHIGQYLWQKCAIWFLVVNDSIYNIRGLTDSVCWTMYNCESGKMNVKCGLSLNLIYLKNKCAIKNVCNSDISIFI